jgi:hypothetical protein
MTTLLGRTLIGPRATPRRTRLGRAVAAAAPRVGGCNCGATPLAAHVLRALGVTTVHPYGSDAAVWRAHIAQERAGLLPALRAVGAAADADALDADHVVYLRLLDLGQPLPPWPGALHSLADHSAREDRLAEAHAPALLAWAAAHAPATTAVGAPLLLLAPTTAAPGGTTTHLAQPVPVAARGWWPWGLGAAGGVATWLLGYGPVGVALGALGGMAAGAVARTALPVGHPGPGARPTAPGFAVDLKLGDLAAPLRSGPPTADNAPDPALQTFPNVDLLVDGANADAAASAALDQASQDALKQQNAEAKSAYKGLVKKIGDYVGVGDEASSWAGLLVDVALGLGKVIKALSGDPSTAANTDYEKARMRDAMAIMIAYGFPPPAMGFEMWGAQDLANETEEEIRVVQGNNWKTGCKTLTIARPGYGDTALDYSPVARELGRSIIVAINNKTYSARTLAMFMAAAKRPGGMLYDRYFAMPSQWTAGATALAITPTDLIPPALLVAYAGAARFGMDEGTARKIVADALTSFAARWRTHVPTVDGDDPTMRCNQVALMLVDAWQAVAGYAASRRLYDGARWAARDYEPVVQ